MLAVTTKELWHWRSNWYVCRLNLRDLPNQDSCLQSLSNRDYTVCYALKFKSRQNKLANTAIVVLENVRMSGVKAKHKRGKEE